MDERVGGCQQWKAGEKRKMSTANISEHIREKFPLHSAVWENDYRKLEEELKLPQVGNKWTVYLIYTIVFCWLNATGAAQTRPVLTDALLSHNQGFIICFTAWLFITSFRRLNNKNIDQMDCFFTQCSYIIWCYFWKTFKIVLLKNRHLCNYCINRGVYALINDKSVYFFHNLAFINWLITG